MRLVRKIVAPLSLLTVFTACNDASFESGASATVPPEVQDATPREAFKLSYEIIAGETASIRLEDLARDGKKEFVDFDKAKLPDDARFDKDQGAIVWQTDLQDIGSVAEGLASVLVDGKVGGDVSFQVKVVEPPVATAACDTTIPPPIGDVKPKQAWHWPGVGDYKITYSSPAAADLDGDGKVEIVSIASTQAYNRGNGLIAVLDGKTGTLLWNSMDQGIFAQASTTPSLVDLDGDGQVEIVVVGFKDLTHGTPELLIINYKTKSVKARYGEADFLCPTSYCNTAVGDLDGDGKPEIVAGNMIFNANGTKKATLGPTLAVQSQPLKAATIVDLVPSSPGQEVIMNGAQVFSSSGNLLWAGDCRGFTAVADLEADGKADLVCVGLSSVYRYDNQGALVWKKPIPSVNGAPSNGGAPNIGDFNGDGKMEIGTAGGAYYVVFDKDGNELWKRATQDLSSSSTGSSLFDFNGDGKVEVVYNDELGLMILDGSSGALLFSEPNPSGTLWEYPLILNVDDDKSVEIVVSAPGMGGVRMFKDPTKLWVGSRNLWNQYSYYPEAVDDKLKMKANPGITKTGFRVNTPGFLGKGDRKLLADIQAFAPRILDRGIRRGEQPKLTAYIFNAGEALPDDDVLVELVIDQEAPLAQVVIGASELKPGRGAVVKLDIPADRVDAVKKSAKLRLNIAEDGKAKFLECKDDNNLKDIKLQDK